MRMISLILPCNPFSCFSSLPFIVFELFDTLILLGVGGHLVYHGPVRRSEKYFNMLNYHLPAGESIADWLIDISSGDMAPSAPKGMCQEVKAFIDKKKRTDTVNKDDVEIDVADTEMEIDDNAMLESDADKAKARREQLYDTWAKKFAKFSKKKRAFYDAPKPFALPEQRTKPSFWTQLGNQLQRLIIVGDRNILTKVVSGKKGRNHVKQKQNPSFFRSHRHVHLSILLTCQA